MHLRKFPVSFVAFLFPLVVTQAYQHKTGFLGLAYVSENSLGKITKSDSGSTSLMGSTDIPLVARVDFTMTKDYFISPRLTYGLLGRKGSDSTTTVTNLHLFAPIGKNLSGAKYDWGIGPGILRRSFKGKGGTVQLSNGTGTSQFAVPGREVVTQTITMNFGMSGNFGPVNAGADLITEGFASSTKRTYSLMLSLTAPLGGSRRSSR